MLTRVSRISLQYTNDLQHELDEVECDRMSDRHGFMEQRYDLEGPSEVEPLHRSFAVRPMPQ